MKRFFPGCIFLFMGSIFPLIGASMAEDGRRTMARCIPVPAEVAGHEITLDDPPAKAEAEENAEPKENRPGLQLRYLADGMPPGAEAFHAQDIGATPIWDQEEFARFPVGKKLTVWADPADFKKAYLERAVSPMPYAIILMPMIFVSFGAMFVVCPPEQGKKQYEPNTPWAWRTFLFVWNTAGIAAAAHYFSQPGSLNAAGIALFSIYLGIGILPVIIKMKRALKI